MQHHASPFPPRRTPDRVPAPLLLVLLAALAAALAGLPAAAQEPPEEAPPLVEEIRVEVVNVDVVVTDDAGRPVTGLTADDFVIYEDGEERPVSNFFSFRNGELRAPDSPAAATAEEPAAWPDSRMRRRMAFLIDNNSLEKRDRARALESLERFVLEQFDGTYEWAVIAYGDDLQLMQPFTSDKTRVLGALGKVAELPVAVRQRHASDRSMLEQLPVYSRRDFRRGRRGIDQATQDLSLRDFDLRERMMAGLERFDQTANAILQVMRAYMGLDGRKSLVLVTGALEMLPGAAQLMGRGLPTEGNDEVVDQFIGVIHADLLRRYDAIIKMANASGFSIYPISADALMEANSSYLDVSRDPTLAFSAGYAASPGEIDVESASRTMADGTGGRFYSTSNFYGAFDDIDDRTANSYVLGFATDHPADGEYHPIRVEAKRDGLKLHHRQGYLHLSREQQIAEELSTPLAFPKDRGDFQVKTEIFLPEEMRKKKVTLTVAGLVPVRDITLIPRGEAMVGRVHLFVALYDPEGNVVGVYRDRQDVQVAMKAFEQASGDAPARFGMTLKDLPRGEYTVSVTLIDDITNRYGTGLSTLAL